MDGPALAAGLSLRNPLSDSPWAYGDRTLSCLAHVSLRHDQGHVRCDQYHCGRDSRLHNQATDVDVPTSYPTTAHGRRYGRRSAVGADQPVAQRSGPPGNTRAFETQEERL